MEAIQCHPLVCFCLLQSEVEEDKKSEEGNGSSI